MTFDTKIAVVLQNDLEVWQKLNVTAFTISGVVGTVEGIMGEAYEDASGVKYLPMIVQPVLIYEAGSERLRTIYNRAHSRNVSFSVFTEDLFATRDDKANRDAVKAVVSNELRLVGMAMRAERGIIDKIFKGVSLHR
jgi:hypothetical protein